MLGCGKGDPPPPTVDEVNAKLERLAQQAPRPVTPAPEQEELIPAVAAPAPAEPPPAPEPEPERPRRRPPPPPLKPAPRQIAPALEGQALAPCTQLVSRVCALLTEGSEECGEARDRLHKPAQTLDQKRCEAAMTWYDERVEDAKRVRPCRLLAQVKCERFGSDSAGCKTAKQDAQNMEKYLLHACKADLLLFRGML